MRRTLALAIALLTILPATAFAGIGTATADSGRASSRSDILQFNSGDTNASYSYRSLTGGSDGAQSITMPSIAVVKSAAMTIGTDRETSDLARTYSDAKKKARFTETGSSWNPVESVVTNAGINLRKYAGDFVETFGDFEGVDNASTTANPLMDKGGYGSEIVSGRDTNNLASSWQSISGNSGVKQSHSITHFFDGRSIRRATIGINANCGSSWSYLAMEVKAFDPSTQTWTSLYKMAANTYTSYNNNNLPLSPAPDYASGKYTQFTLKSDCSSSWNNPSITLSWTYLVEKFLLTSEVVSQPVDPVITYGWSPTWNVYNLTLIPSELIPFPAGTSIVYYISATNGTRWEPITKNQTFVLGSIDPLDRGHILRWKAVFTAGPTLTTTARIQDRLELKYDRLFSSNQVYTSTVLAQDWPVTRITTWFNQTTPAGTKITLALSNDGGANWTNMSNGATRLTPFISENQLDHNRIQFMVTLESPGTGVPPKAGLSTPVFRNLTIDWEISMYPTNVVVDFGSDEAVSFEHKGILFPSEGPITIAGVGSDDFPNELNGLLPHLGVDTTTIAMNVSSTTAGKIWVTGFKITYGLPPVLDTPIPEQTFTEDSGLADAINLEDYFSDDFDDGDLAFELTFQEEPTKILGALKDGKLSFSAPTANWTGSRRFLVRAVDLGGLATPSNTFSVTVTNLNDPPLLAGIPDQVAYVEQPLSYTPEVKDGDPGDTHSWELTSDPPDARLFIDRITGTITTTPEKADILINPDDAYTVTVKVSDGLLTASTTFKLQVKNQNTGPSLEGVPSLFVPVDKTLTHLLEAHDIDVPYGDVLVWVLEKDSTKATTMTITKGANPEQATLSWTPAKGDLGTVTVKVIVRDSVGAEASQSFKVTVTAENQPPSKVVILSPTPTHTPPYNTTVAVLFEGFADDPDPTDDLTFRWYLDGSTQEFGTGSQFKTIIPPSAGAGPWKHTVTLVVDDGNGHTVSATSEFTVQKAGKNDVITTRPPPNEVTQRIAGFEPAFFALILGIAAMIGLAAVTFGLSRRHDSTLRKLEAEREGTAGGGDRPVLRTQDQLQLPGPPPGLPPGPNG